MVFLQGFGGKVYIQSIYNPNRNNKTPSCIYSHSHIVYHTIILLLNYTISYDIGSEIYAIKIGSCDSHLLSPQCRWGFVKRGKVLKLKLED